MSNGIVVSSRARLARDIAGYPFPSRLDSERALEVTQKVYAALGKAQEKYTIMRMSDLDELRVEALKELHIISDDLIHGNKYAAVIVDPTNEISVMVNEEDHIRAQCILRGNRLDEAYRKINEVDDLISAELKLAYDPEIGYLTACPTNVGTGLRASAMMFLPGLSLTGSLAGCVNAANHFDMTVRGEYGEGSESQGFLYQVSNQKTLGVTEDDILKNVNAAVARIEQSEIAARKALMDADKTAMCDKIYRAYGALTNAYSMDGKEFAEKLAYVKLGVYYGLFVCEDESRLDAFAEECRAANLMLKAGEVLTAEERDRRRAAMCEKEITALVKKARIE